MDKILEKKSGFLMKKAESIFEENTIKCENGHVFYALENDIILGKWCEHCKDNLATILENLNIPYEKNKKIGNFIYDYVIEGSRNFLIFTDNNSKKDMIENGKNHNYNIQILHLLLLIVLLLYL